MAKPLDAQADAHLYETIAHLKSKMTPEHAEAGPIAAALVTYVRSLVPIRITEDDPCAQTQWIVLRLISTLESVFLLGEAGHCEDASALVRVMLDHLLAFAWLLADDESPTRINAWKNNDLRLINAQRSETKSLGVDFAAVPEPLETTVSWASAAQAARECDDFWEQYLQPFLRKGTLYSFVGLYAAVFRGTSAYIHPSPLRGGAGFFLVGKEESKDWVIGTSFATLPGMYCDAVVIALLAVWILVARFRHDDVPKIIPLFDRVVVMRTRWSSVVGPRTR